jgi:hypothetical protein
MEATGACGAIDRAEPCHSPGPDNAPALDGALHPDLEHAPEVRMTHVFVVGAVVADEVLERGELHIVASPPPFSVPVTPCPSHSPSLSRPSRLDPDQLPRSARRVIGISELAAHLQGVPSP